MRGADRHAVLIGGDDGDRGHDFSRGALRVGQVLLADLLAHGDDDALPAHHGAEAQSDGNRDLDPGGNVLGRVVELLLVCAETPCLGGGERAPLPGSCAISRNASPTRYISLRTFCC